LRALIARGAGAILLSRRMDQGVAMWARGRYEGARHLRKFEETIVQVAEGQESALKFANSLVDSGDGGAGAAILIL
jgi:hypothetical protein